MDFWSRAQSAGFKLPELDALALNRTFPYSNCRLLDGKLLAQDLLQQCKQQVALNKVTPCLEVILVGDNPASHVYVRNKETAFRKAGFTSRVTLLKGEEVTTESLLLYVDKLNADSSVHGVLVQLPLPSHIDSARVLSRIAPHKDVDGFLPENIGKLACDRDDATIACTPFGVMVMLASYKIPLAGARALVVGRSQIVGRPMSLLLLGADATVTMAHSRSRDLKRLCRESDIIVAAAGKAALIQEDFVSPGTTVIDVGMNRGNKDELCGDVDSAVSNVAAAMSPVPGGVGPMTIAMLCINTALAAWQK